MAETTGMTGDTDRLAEDNPEWDGTDAAHPAWWRGNDAGVAATVRILADAMDGKDNGRGVIGYAPLEALRRRVIAVRSARQSALDEAAQIAEGCGIGKNGIDLADRIRSLMAPKGEGG